MTYDVFVFPVIDWHFRIQRPQQIARELARRGHRVFYLTVPFAPSSLEQPYVLCGSPEENVFIVQLRCPDPHPNIYTRLANADQTAALLDSLRQLKDAFGIAATVSIVDLAFWREIALRMGGDAVVYDCMDFHAGWDFHQDRAMLDEEDRLIGDADIVIASAAGLAEIVARVRPSTLIRNGCEASHFLAPVNAPRRLSPRPVAGYFGAINHWYDIDLVVTAARACPEWIFVLVGDTRGCDTAAARLEPNIRFMGEIPYAVLPDYVHGFDVCLIPFKIDDLTLHTNPVKLYEYLAAGKPVVGTAMPEIMLGGEGLVYIGRDPDEYVARLKQAMAEHDRPEYVERRVAYAMGQTWASRVDTLEAVIADFLSTRPKP